MIYTAIRKLIHKEHCSFTAGYQTYDFIYITDAINAIIAVAEKASRSTATTSVLVSLSRCGSSCWKCGIWLTRRLKLGWGICPSRV